MASPSAILAASKAARTVPYQQGNGVQGVPGGNATWGGIYATQAMLPRPADDFTEGAFSPLDPIYPYPVDQPPPGLERPRPRRRQYQVGENLPGSGQRTQFSTLSFETLRGLSVGYSVARACIKLLKSEIRGLQWDVVPTKDAAKAMRGSHKAMRDFGERRAKVIRFFGNPDPEYGTWNSWIDTLLEDVLSIDALTVYLRPARIQGRGLLGSDLSALELIDGSTIRPLVDLSGSRPSPPSVAFQQYIWGVPRTDNMSIMLDLDLGPGMKDGMVHRYRGDQLLYLPFERRTPTPYGLPPIEQALVPVMNGLAKQVYQGSYFSESSIPQVYISPGDMSITAAQVKELQEAFNIISGDLGYKFKVVVLPPGSKTMPMKDPALADQFDAIVMQEVCCATGTKVATRRGLVPIEQVQPGDLVLTHAGRWRSVRKLMRNPVHDQVHRIEARGFDALEVTGNHPVWAATYGQTPSHRKVYEGTDWIAARDVRPKRSRGKSEALTLPVPVMGNSDASLRLIDHVTPGVKYRLREVSGWLVHPHPRVKPVPADVPMNAALGRILGFYMSEGSTANDSFVEFYFHKNETAYHEMVIADLESVFGLSAKVLPAAGENCVKVKCQSMFLARLLRCGTARTKRLPAWAWDGSPEFYASLLWAWVAGDGCLTGKGWRGYSTSYDLAWQMRLIALACGHEPQLRSQPQARSSIGARAIRGADRIWVVEVILDQKRRGMYRLDGPHLTSPVRSNEVIEYSDDAVWNLEVEEDESYVTTGGTVHNCMAFAIQPTELGLMPQVATVQTPSAVNMANKSSNAIHQRKSLVPMLQFLKEGLLDKVIQIVCRQPDMQFMFDGLEEDEDEETLTNLIISQIGAGLCSVDEGRAEIGRDPWGLEVTQDPLWASANGVMLLGSVDPSTGQPAGMPAALPSPQQAMQGATGGSTTQANQGQVNPRPALAQGHMPGTTHVPPAQANRQPTPAHAAAVAGAAESAARTSASSSKSAALHKYVAVTPGDPSACAECFQPHSYPVHAVLKARRMLAGTVEVSDVPARPPFHVITDLVTAPDAASLSAEAVHALYSAPPAPAVSSSPKAALSELDALGRHIRKGRDPKTWQPVHIPGALMASITEDLTKGLDAAEVLTAAASVVYPKASPSAQSQWLAWEHDEALAEKYRQQIAAAFAEVEREAAILFGQFLGGTLKVTAAVLASMIADLLREKLAEILARIHAEGFALGWQSAAAAAGQPGKQQPPQAQNSALALQAAIRQMSATGMAGLAAALAKALLTAGVTVGTLVALLASFLNADWRAALIAWNELLEAIAEGVDAAYAELGVLWADWITANDDRVCARCKANKAASPRPVGSIWPGTGTVSTPGHIRCRCARIPAKPPADAVTKAAKDWDWKHPDTSLPIAEQVYRQLLEDFPPEAIAWVKRAKWTGPEQVPLDVIEYQPSKWAAGHEQAKVERFRRKIAHRAAKGKIGHKPAVLCDRPDTPEGTHLYVVDGHHRVVADHELERPVDAYVGIVGAEDVKAAQETHSSQLKEGDPGASDTAASKSFTAGSPGGGSVSGLVPLSVEGQDEAPVAAGVAVRAADTGRVLMLQRAVSEDDPASGCWEFPGGCLDDGEYPVDAAAREWAEETGMAFPEGSHDGMWASRNGAYRGFVLTVPSEFPVHEDRDQVTNPDDPDADQVEALAWWDVSQLPGNPAVRRELAADLDLVLAALADVPAEKSALTPYLSAHHRPLGREGLWHTPGKKVPVRQQLPAYVQNIARALMRDRGVDEHEAIAMAVAAVERWRHGRLGWGPRRHVTREVIEASERTHQEWEQERAAHH